jgi:hypothetical protein
MHDLFAPRLLLRRFPARRWDGLRFHNGEVHQTFQEAARQLVLVLNRDQDAEICLQDATDLNRPASGIGFLLAQMVYYGASRESLETRFCDHLADDGETPDYVRRKLISCSILLICHLTTVPLMINYLYLPILILICPS